MTTLSLQQFESLPEEQRQFWKKHKLFAENMGCDEYIPLTINLEEAIQAVTKTTLAHIHTLKTHMHNDPDGNNKYYASIQHSYRLLRDLIEAITKLKGSQNG